MKPSLLRIRLVWILIIIFCEGGLVYSQTITYNGSAQFSTGSYFFTENTNSFYLNSGFSFRNKGISIGLNIPYIVQSTPWISVSSGSLIATGGPGNERVGGERNGNGNRRGGRKIDPGIADTISYSSASFGDPNLSGNIKLYESKNQRTSVQTNLNIKFPLADPTDGFGTGAWDFGAGMSIFQRIGSDYLWILDVMHWRLGDMNNLEFKNPVSFSSGLGRSFSNGKWLISANIYGYTRIIEEIEPPLSSGLNAGPRINPKMNLNASVVIGLSDSNPDVSTGLGWSVTF